MTDAGRALRRYLRDHNVSVPQWCAEHALDRIRVQRLLNGEYWQRVSIPFAEQLIAATRGELRFEDFSPTTARGEP